MVSSGCALKSRPSPPSRRAKAEVVVAVHPVVVWRLPTFGVHVALSNLQRRPVLHSRSRPGSDPRQPVVKGNIQVPLLALALRLSWEQTNRHVITSRQFQLYCLLGDVFFLVLPFRVEASVFVRCDIGDLGQKAQGSYGQCRTNSARIP